MLEKSFIEIYDKFKLNFYKNIFKGFERKEEALTVTESFTLEVLYSLNGPTISELSEYLGISQPNTTYKVNELIQKGYVEKTRDPKDKRRVILSPTEQFAAYYEAKLKYINTVLARMRNEFSTEQIHTLEYILQTMSNKLMPEVSQKN